MTDTILRKTWKRETAMALLAWLAAIVTWITFADTAAGAEILKAMIWPIFTLAAAMFGIQVYQQTTAAQFASEEGGTGDGAPFRTPATS